MKCVNCITVYPRQITIQTGHWYYDAWAEVCPVDAEIVWYSDNTSVASVNEASGYIYANSPGTVRIYAQATDGSGISDYLTVTVSGTIAVQTVTLNRTSLSIKKGNSAALSATVYPTNATNKAINWRSANTNIATVSNGCITAKAKGSTYIYAEAADGSGAYGRCYVSVTEAVLVKSVDISPSRLTMTAGESTRLYATVCPSDAAKKCVKWSTRDWCVATVNPESGFVYAVNAGEARIIAMACDGSSVYGECVITVEPPVAVEGIRVSPTSLTMNAGDTRVLEATVCPPDATNKTVTWRSSDENVATVELRTGLVTAKDAGTAVITATTIDGDFESSSVITVPSTDPFHYSNIEFLRIKKYDMSSYGGDSDITTIVTKSTLSSDQYFEAMAADRANVAFIINDAMKNELNTQATVFQSTAIIFTVPFYFYLAKLGVDDMVSNGIISDESAEYYGIWASETNRLLRGANKISNLIQLTLSVVTMVYSIYNIVSAIKAAKMSMNSTQTYYSASYKAAVDNTDELFGELSAAGTKYTKENTMWICRNPNGKICWLETGTDHAGFKHILNGHPVSSFSSFNVSSEVGVSSLIYDVVSTQTPVGTYGVDGLVYAYGGNKYLNVVISTNGYIVNAYNVSNDIGRIIFY